MEAALFGSMSALVVMTVLAVANYLAWQDALRDAETWAKAYQDIWSRHHDSDSRIERAVAILQGEEEDDDE